MSDFEPDEAPTTLHILPGGMGLFSVTGGDHDGRTGTFFDGQDVVWVVIRPEGQCRVLGSSRYANDSNTDLVADSLEMLAKGIRERTVKVWPDPGERGVVDTSDQGDSLFIPEGWTE